LIAVFMRQECRAVKGTLRPMTYVPGPFGLDCSDAAQDARRRQLEEMLAKMRSGVSTVGDRGRNVSYRSPSELWPMAQHLQKEIIACETGYWWPGRKRLGYVDQVKGL
jgi:hypothetical protein